MINLTYAILAFLLAIGILTVVHEYGHFMFARLAGVEVLRFSIGFGKPIFSWLDAHGTEFAIGLFPLGGYVTLLGQNEDEIVPPNEGHRAFRNKSVFARMLTIAAGRGFILIFALL